MLARILVAGGLLMVPAAARAQGAPAARPVEVGGNFQVIAPSTYEPDFSYGPAPQASAGITPRVALQIELAFVPDSRTDGVVTVRARHMLAPDAGIYATYGASFLFLGSKGRPGSDNDGAVPLPTGGIGKRTALSGNINLDVEGRVTATQFSGYKVTASVGILFAVAHH